jgi:transcriptional regulator
MRSARDGGAGVDRYLERMEPRLGRYAPATPGDVLRLAETAPLAWMVSPDPFAATPLPLRARTDAAGGLIRLDGHLARRNPQLEILRRHPVAWVLFLGPNGYVSPSWMADRTQAPTWNYAALAVRARLRLIEDPAGVGASLQDLAGAHEAGRPRAWSPAEMGARFAALAQGVVAFEAEILDARPVFKLGQDERDDVYADILAGLQADGAAVLADWMRAANPGRRDRR